MQITDALLDIEALVSNFRGGYFSGSFTGKYIRMAGFKRKMV